MMNKENFTSIEIGNNGEKYAQKFLKKNRYKILEKNYKNAYAEIDIIAKSKEYIVFVEVKTRDKNTAVLPSVAVNKRKQEHIFKCASVYLRKNNINLSSRFDVIEVYVDSQSLKLVSINHIENAFSQGGEYARF